jgi:methyltransferase-like protein/cyclopropane fatty-acyl-phospholipid synthase-like methyltransferase
MAGSDATSYDTLPYQGNFIPMTHPDRMATMAVLHGMKPPPVERCRVLELGCTDGGNLLTIAQTLPHASLLGVDLSPRQVAEGQATVQALGVGNVELRTLNLTEIDDTYGLFDYIICHGLYSWVTASVRDKILQICAHNLAPNGVAYMSYNVYPGWGQRGMLREMMLYHTQGITDPTAQVQQARALLDFVTRHATPQDGPYARYLREESKKLEKFPDSYLFHDYLAEENQPVYFHEFVAHAVPAGLRYLSHSMFSIEESRLSPEFRQIISRLGSDVVRREQYVDFVLNRTFRQSLLCHAGVRTYESPWPEAVQSLRLVALARPENPMPELLSKAHQPFLTMYGDKLMVDEPLIKAALFALYELWPRSMGFEKLWASTLELLGRSEAAAGADRTEFATKLLECHMMQLVNMQTFDPPIATEPGERPRADALARRNATRAARVISLRNHIAVLEEIDRLVVPLLDGSRDQAAVVDELAGAVAAGKLNLKSDGKPITEPAAVREALVPIVKSSLQRLADQALLIAD